MSGEMRTAAVTPVRSSTPATSAPSIWPADVPAKPARTNAPIIAEVTAATGTPTPIASPALAAVGGVPRAAEVRPAPSSASAGRLKSAYINPSDQAPRWRGRVNWRATPPSRPPRASRR